MALAVVCAEPSTIRFALIQRSIYIYYLFIHWLVTIILCCKSLLVQPLVALCSLFTFSSLQLSLYKRNTNN